MRLPTFAVKARMKGSPLSLVCGWAALAVYLVAYAPVGLGVAALVGSFDRNHQVQVRFGERELALVLHHGLNCAEHRHGAIARALICFAQPSSPTNPDHVIQFSAADTLSSKAQLALPPLQGSEQPPAALTDLVLASSLDAAHYFPPSRPPPGEGGPVRGRLSTVLLI
jgi:hypothetical protein